MNRYLQIAILIILGGIVVFVIPKISKAPTPQITNFEQCQQAGGSVDAGVCVAPNGTCCYYDENYIQPEVIVDTPQPGDLVTSPLPVKGRATGFWYFEANLPVTLKDTDGNILAQKGFQAQGEWMTEEYVEFEDILTFTTPGTEYGVLVIEKDNPSGLSEFDASFAVPVRFK
jgi:hypothetical protein